MDQSPFNSSSSSSNHTFSNSSSFRFKRRNPFGEDRGDDNHVNKTRNQSRMSVFESTMNQMMRSSSAAFSIPQPSQFSIATCHSCRTYNARVVPCAHCGRGSCESCVQRCEDCEEIFCTFCRTTNYDLRWDRELCFSCNDAASHSTR